jgi:hypothetical protein
MASRANIVEVVESSLIFVTVLTTDDGHVVVVSQHEIACAEVFNLILAHPTQQFANEDVSLQNAFVYEIK